jgi:hypothetical protein
MIDAKKIRFGLEEDVVYNTINRNIRTAEKPRRQSLTVQTWKAVKVATAQPTTLNKNHKIQLKSEKAAVLLTS